MDKSDFGLGDRMKMYEGVEAGRRFMPLLPICARLDGKCFHKYTKNMDRPFDSGLHEDFVETTQYLVEESGAKIGYTQSDEITLIFYVDKFESQVFFDGKIQKMCSVLTSMCVNKFNRVASVNYCIDIPLADFDCRVWQVPNQIEACNVLLWREFDATRNSVSMAAQSVYSHKELQNKNSSQMQEMLFQKGINWNYYPAWFKRGSYIQRYKVERPFTDEEWIRIPEKRRPIDRSQSVVRNEVDEIYMPVFSKVSNKIDVVFNGAVPEVESE